MPTATKVDVGYCGGSGIKATRAGSKYVRGKLRYKCPICEGHFAKDMAGHLHRHGYTLGAYRGVNLKSVCASCSKTFDGLDYLCGKCRGE